MKKVELLPKTILHGLFHFRKAVFAMIVILYPLLNFKVERNETN